MISQEFAGDGVAVDTEDEDVSYSDLGWREPAALLLFAPTFLRGCVIPHNWRPGVNGATHAEAGVQSWLN